MDWPDRRICDLFDIDHPIVQAPMAAASGPAMAAAAANSGALGSLGCAFFDADKIADETRAVREVSNRSVNLNFFVHRSPDIDAAKIRLAQDRLEPWYQRFGLQPAADMSDPGIVFDQAICAAVLAASPKVVSFHFGLPDAKFMTALQEAGIVVISSATSVAEALWLENRGVDAVIAQGSEAGGHSGWFLDNGGADVAGTMALVPRIVDAVSVPVIAAGGIADGRGIAAALMLGAAGVQIGTAFLATPESTISAVHKTAIIDASGDDTMVSRAFSGRRARTVANAFARDMAGVADWPDFPLMNAATGPLRAASAGVDQPEAVALWSGQGVGLVRAQATADVVARLVIETASALGQPVDRN